MAVTQAPLRQMTRGLERLLILLGIQFLIGMMTNLWVVIPETHPGSNAPDYFLGLLQGIPWALVHGPLMLQLHIAVGLGLWVFSTLVAILAVRGRHGCTLRTVAVLGWIGVTGAGFNGGSFLNYGHDISSFLMSLGFILAATCYVWGLAHCMRLVQSSERGATHG